MAPCVGSFAIPRPSQPACRFCCRNFRKLGRMPLFQKAKRRIEPRCHCFLPRPNGTGRLSAGVSPSRLNARRIGKGSPKLNENRSGQESRRKQKSLGGDVTSRTTTPPEDRAKGQSKPVSLLPSGPLRSRKTNSSSAGMRRRSKSALPGNPPSRNGVLCRLRNGPIRSSRTRPPAVLKNVQGPSPTGKHVQGVSRPTAVSRRRAREAGSVPGPVTSKRTPRRSVSSGRPRGGHRDNRLMTPAAGSRHASLRRMPAISNPCQRCGRINSRPT